MGEIYTKQFGVNFKSEPDPIKPKLNRSLIFHNKVRTAAKETNNRERMTTPLLRKRLATFSRKSSSLVVFLDFYNQQSLQKFVHPRRNLVVHTPQLEHQQQA